MSQSNKKQQPRAATKSNIPFTLLHKWILSIFAAIGIALVLFSYSSNAESIDPAPSTVAVEVEETVVPIISDPVETEEETDGDSFRERFSRAYDYVVSGETEEILDVEAEHLRELSSSLGEREQDLEAEAYRLEELTTTLETRESLAAEQHKLYANQLASLGQCVAAAMAVTDG